MKRYLVICLAVLALFIQPALVGAESLWQDNARMANLYQDVKARNVGDIVTIVISEISTAARSGSASNSKNASLGLAAGTGGWLDWIGPHTISGSDSFNAQGSINNTNKVSANITVQVVGVQPNGNLLLSGTQAIKQNKDLQNITITGEVRPEDITSGNTVLSTYVANAKITIDGKGPIMRKQRQGILTQVLNFLL